MGNTLTRNTKLISILEIIIEDPENIQANILTKEYLLKEHYTDNSKKLIKCLAGTTTWLIKYRASILKAELVSEDTQKGIYFKTGFDCFWAVVLIIITYLLSR